MSAPEPEPAFPPPPALAPHSRFRTWLAAVFSPRTPGMHADTPRVDVYAFGLMLGVLALQVVARYKLGFLEDKHWQIVHVLIGWGACFGIFVLFHGKAALARISRATWLTLGVGLVCLTLFWYLGRSDSYRVAFGEPPRDYDTLWPIVPFLYFAAMGTLLRLVVPFVFARYALHRPPRELGLPIGRGRRHGAVPGIGWVYLVLALGIAPVVVIAANAPAFQMKYPLGRDLIDPDGGIALSHLLVYQAFYFLVFLSGESFWRGFLAFGTEKDLGLYGLAIMCVPYVTGHFGKPFSETLGAILAGTVLGFLALRHRSVVLGVALHYGVALSMDLLSIWKNGFVIYLG